MAELTLTDIYLIQPLLRKFSYDDIAEIINRPVELVKDYADGFLLDKNIVSKQSLIDEKRIKKEWKILKERKKKNDEEWAAAQKKEMLIRRQNREAERINKRKRSEVSYGNKQVDWTKKILVRIDHKTMIYVDPGTDIAVVKKKYMERMSRAKLLITPKTYTEVKKFKPIK